MLRIRPSSAMKFFCIFNMAKDLIKATSPFHHDHQPVDGFDFDGLPLGDIPGDGLRPPDDTRLAAMAAINVSL